MRVVYTSKKKATHHKFRPKILTMNTIIILSFLMATSYITALFIRHSAASICARHRGMVGEAPKVAITPVVQTANLYQDLTIRQLKKLASGRVKKYSNMTKKELMEVLA